MIIISIIVLMIIIWVSRVIYQYNNTETKETSIFVLKNEMTSDWVGGTDVPFNLLKDIEEFSYCDKVEIIKIDTLKFGKIVNSKLEVSKSYMDDED